MSELIPIEYHPLIPFLPSNAKVLMLGSFPPQQKRWSMDFYYPNLQNDMWRIFGIIFKSDRNAFVDLDNKRFNKPLLVDFLNEIGVALYDTASAIKRLQGNASDAALEVVEPTDVPALLRKIPKCTAIVTTGQKATDTLRALFHLDQPVVGGSVAFRFEDRDMKLYRMPSSSRAYPMKIEKKAEYYRKMFDEIGFFEK